MVDLVCPTRKSKPFPVHAKNLGLEKHAKVGFYISNNNVLISNFLLTEHEGRTVEYWREVERSDVCTKPTEGQYSLVRLEQARLVTNLLYGTRFSYKFR